MSYMYFSFSFWAFSHICMCYIFTQGYSLDFFLFFIIYGGLGLGGWVLIIGFLGWAFQLMGFGAFGFLGCRSLYKHKRKTLWRKMVPLCHSYRKKCLVTSTKYPGTPLNALPPKPFHNHKHPSAIFMYLFLRTEGEISRNNVGLSSQYV